MSKEEITAYIAEFEEKEKNIVEILGDDIEAEYKESETLPSEPLQGIVALQYASILASFMVECQEALKDKEETLKNVKFLTDAYGSTIVKVQIDIEELNEIPKKYEAIEGIFNRVQKRQDVVQKIMADSVKKSVASYATMKRNAI